MSLTGYARAIFSQSWPAQPTFARPLVRSFALVWLLRFGFVSLLLEGDVEGYLTKIARVGWGFVGEVVWLPLLIEVCVVSDDVYDLFILL